MQPGIKNIVIRSLSHYRRAALYQFLIVTMLSAVITGSLLTGYSVRQSLKNSAVERLGNTGILISSGIRNFDTGLAEKLTREQGFPAVALIETDGFCRSFTGDGKSSRTKIFGIDSSFFRFLGHEGITLRPGEAVINKALAERIRISEGEEIILNINKPDDIPANSPFAPSRDASEQAVYKVAGIIDKNDGGDFSPGINQITPDNVFINLYDIPGIEKEGPRANRILVDYRSRLNETGIENNLKEILSPGDIGLKLRKSNKTGETELISSRIFIDQEIIDEIIAAIPGGHPLITYLVNGIELGVKSTPYSFVAAIDAENYDGIEGGAKIVINRWLADDLDANINDTLQLTWYEPGKIRELEEVSGKFVISGIEDNEGIWADSLLMPEFPGIAGSESCTDWDAGVEIRTERIRTKDEDYWNNFRGKPKAYISYSKGREIWGNNFGPATAIRFPSEFSEDDIIKGLTGKLNPLKCGLTVKNLRNEMIRAANESVDFSTLFLSLGFFIIVSCIFLLILAVSAYFDSRKDQVFTLFALGFSNKWIGRMLFYETSVITVAGATAGIIAGLAINTLIIVSLNSVWIGAVQSSSLSPAAGSVPMAAGFFTTIIICFIFLYIRIRRFLKKLRTIDEGGYKSASAKTNLYLLLTSAAAAVALAVTGLTGRGEETTFAFAAGGSLFLTLILLWRQIILRKFSFRLNSMKGFNFISGSYYSFHPGRGVMPVLLIAAGLFAVIITGINRLQITEKSTSPSGGTGGFELWAETVSPVMEDLNSKTGRKIHGLEETDSGIMFIQGMIAGGDDASCLNLNHVVSPPVLGIDPEYFIESGSFSFSTIIKTADRSNPWEIITRQPEDNCIFGFADQTVMQWGLKKKTGDTLKFRSETGELFNVILAGGLKSSLFQGYLIIGERNFVDYFPSVSGSSLFLTDCEETIADSLAMLLRTRFESYGIEVQPAKEKLASFFRVTNTYLAVFTTLGGLGLILGVIGLGFVLRQNYNSRKREFALMMASGFTGNMIKQNIFREQLFILIAGVITGTLSSFVATYPSLSGGSDIPWGSILGITIAITVTGILALLISLRGINQQIIITSLRRE